MQAEEKIHEERRAPAFRRILLKASGEALMGAQNYGVDVGVAREVAEQIRDIHALGVEVAVVVSDTFGRPWREGQTDVAIGIAGIAPLRSYIGEVDPHGHEFRVQELCVVDELAGAAELVKGNTSRVPVAVARGYPWSRDDGASMRSVIRDAERDLFR
ncbi:MAG: coenzyme F420-0:L-glutamate ligase [Pyrinomonadaceae bacterium]